MSPSPPAVALNRASPGPGEESHRAFDPAEWWDATLALIDADPGHPVVATRLTSLAPLDLWSLWSDAERWARLDRWCAHHLAGLDSLGVATLAPLVTCHPSAAAHAARHPALDPPTWLWLADHALHAWTHGDGGGTSPTRQGALAVLSTLLGRYPTGLPALRAEILKRRAPSALAPLPGPSSLPLLLLRALAELPELDSHELWSGLWALASDIGPPAQRRLLQRPDLPPPIARDLLLDRGTPPTPDHLDLLRALAGRADRLTHPQLRPHWLLHPRLTPDLLVALARTSTDGVEATSLLARLATPPSPHAAARLAALLGDADHLPAGTRLPRPTLAALLAVATREDRLTLLRAAARLCPDPLTGELVVPPRPAE